MERGKVSVLRETSTGAACKLQAAKMTSPEQEIELLWVCVNSGESYNADWNLTMGAIIAKGPEARTNVTAASRPNRGRTG